MKKNYLLIISGIIPLLLVFYLVRFFGEDERYKIMQNAILLNSETFGKVKLEDLVLVHGKISQTQKIFSNGFVAYQVEEKIKERDRSVWKTKESEIPSLNVLVDSQNIILNLDKDYVLCGSLVQVQRLPNLDPKKHRILGLLPNTLVTAYGKVTSLNPTVVHVGKSLCAESLVEYKTALSKKSYAYVVAILFLAIPSLFLVYLGLFRAEG